MKDDFARVTRIIAIIRAFDEGKVLTARMIAERFHVSVRTAQRTLLIAGQFVPIVKPSPDVYVSEYRGASYLPARRRITPPAPRPVALCPECRARYLHREGKLEWCEQCGYETPASLWAVAS